MPIEYLAYLNLILLTRLVYLAQDQPLGRWGSAVLTIIQAALCAMTLQWTLTLWVILACVFVFTGLGGLVERRVDNTAIWRLVSLAGLILIPGSFFQATGGNGFSALYQGVSDVALSHIPLLNAQLSGGRVGLLLLGCLLVANEANIAMRVVLHYLKLEPRKTGVAADSDVIDEAEFKAGRIIGVLERWLILLIVAGSNELTALGFIIAAKGLVRFNKFADDRFAEYVLVGTLLSVLIAVVVVKWILLLQVI